MDEPFGALDPLIRATVKAEFKQLQQQLQLTVVMVTHDVQEAFLLGDEVMLLHEGKVMQQGSPRELLFTPQNEFVKRFFDAQRLQLELSIPTLGQLSPYLQSADTDLLPGLAEFHESDTLLSLLEQANRADQVMVQLTWDSMAPSQHSTAQLLDAFNRWKATGAGINTQQV